MERGAKANAKVEPRRAVTRRTRKVEASAGLPFEQRLAEALEQHAAISEILRVISSSLGDVTPVLATVAERAARLCDASFAQVLLVEGNVLRPTVAYWADSGPEADYDDSRRVKRTWPLTRSILSGRAALDCKTIHHADVLPLVDSEYPDSRAKQQELGMRAVLVVPLLREGGASGVIVMFRREPRPFSPGQVALVETFADQAAIAIENVRLFNETRERLEQQTATSEILRVISRSPTDVQPVFDTIAAAALKLCNARSAVVLTFDGELLQLAAFANVSPEGADSLRRRYPTAPGRGRASGRAILTRRIAAIPDVLEDPEFDIDISLVGAGFRSVVAVPLLREDSPIGAITVARAEPGSFPEKQITLLQTFADQAVIAIANVRLFNETAEALEKQAAISEILQVISSSPGDVKPMLNAVVERALELCGAADATVFLVEGERLRSAARFSDTQGAVEEGEFIALTRGSVTGRAVIDRTPIHLEDLATVSEEEFPVGRELQRRLGHRTTLSVPLMREDRAIGAIALWRMETRRFTDEQVALVKTFADQAAIAIENVRLFNETKEALEQQTATSEILRVISRSPRDVQPVFDTIAGAAQKLCGATSANLFTFDGQLVHLAAHARPNLGPSDAADLIALQADLPALYRNFPRPPGRDLAAPRAVLTCSVVSIPDVLADVEYEFKEVALAGGFRGVLAVPLIRNGAPIGAIVVGRPEPGQFPDKQLALLQTFADQAVIAIENVRLFTELDARTAQLTRSVGELKALGEVGQAVSSTLDLETVLSTIVSRATQLAGMDGGSIWEYEETREEFHLHATNRLPDEMVEVLRATPIRKGEGALGRLAVTGEPVEIPDIVDEPSYPSRVRDILIRSGYRAVLAVPLLRENRLLGALAVNRSTAGAFGPEVVGLLKTFAAQSALAIQNARLFREIEDKGRQLAVASQHKSEFLANMSHELRTPLNAIIGFSEVLAERMFGDINEKQADYLHDILESGRHLLSLINDILDLSKIEAGRMELEPTVFNLPAAIDNTLTLVRERAHRHGITLACHVDEQLGVVCADERKVKQVLLNLLSNAVKFTPEGGRIDVRAAVRDGVAEVSVTDTGIGIAPEDQPKVFDEFRQVGTAAKKVEGTGLGLAISRKFIELHGGRIWVESQVGLGSTFAFTLPLTIDRATA